MHWQSVGFMCGICLSVPTHEYLNSTIFVVEPRTFDTPVEEIFGHGHGGRQSAPSQIITWLEPP